MGGNIPREMCSRKLLEKLAEAQVVDDTHAGSGMMAPLGHAPCALARAGGRRAAGCRLLPVRAEGPAMLAGRSGQRALEPERGRAAGPARPPAPGPLSVTGGTVLSFPVDPARP